MYSVVRLHRAPSVISPSADNRLSLICSTSYSAFSSSRRRSATVPAISMLPSRESFITALIHSKLSLRRIYRNWRRSTPPEKRVPVLAPDSSDPSADLNTRARRPAELPARPPDRNPLPLPLILAALFILALAVRLTNISYPPVVVFDEVHFLRFTRQYFYGEYFFDIHPPLGKLVLLTIIKLFCGPPKVKFNSNGASFGHQRYLPLRVTSAFFGAALSPLCYLISRELGLSVPASLFPAIVQAVEQLAVIESRLVLLDAQLMFWMAVCLLCALRMWGRKPLKRWPLVCATALSGSAAVSVKWTALATPGMIAIVSLIGAPFPAQRLALKEMGVAGGLAVSLYTVLFYIHFRLLPKSGDGDAFMKETFKATLIGNKLYDPKHRGPGFISNFLYLNYEMYIANKGIKTRHFWESKYWQWVLNKRGLLYYSEVSKADPTYHEKIYLIVNPAVTAVTCISLVICILMSAVWVIRRWRSRAPSKKRLERRRMHSFILRGAFLLSGYVFNLLPYVEVARCTFLYHYLPALFYALFCVANLIDLVPNPRSQRIVSTVLIAFVLGAFWYWKPWIYATGVTIERHSQMRLQGKGWE